MGELRFEWDPAKATANERKHGITFAEAESVFSDEHALLLDDPDHSSTKEERFILLGLSAGLRVLVVVHCYIAPDDAIRLISAPKATGPERQHYTSRWRP
jgi:hypothetical protein